MGHCNKERIYTTETVANVHMAAALVCAMAKLHRHYTCIGCYNRELSVGSVLRRYIQEVLFSSGHYYSASTVLDSARTS